MKTVITLVVLLATQVFAQESRFDQLANLPLKENRPTPEAAKTLQDELLFQRATETYLLGDAAHQDRLQDEPRHRLYSPTEPALNKTWKPSDIQKVSGDSSQPVPAGVGAAPK